ncbi:MAG: oxygen-independent coproporphyrinogen III oxidase [Bacteroidota bacterium]
MDLNKFNIAVPRYTSYPIVPFWKDDHFTIKGYEKSLGNAYWESAKEISLYIHLPFCESLCTYCACNVRITKNHDVELPYIDYLLKEWNLYLDKLPYKPVIKEIHLGGGTPTFFSSDNLDRLLSGILKGYQVAIDPLLSFEGHPSNTTSSHLRILRSFGFNRVSFGIQDFDLNVQKLINRMQSFDQVQAVTKKARALGYESVNFDIVYGLPGQTEKSVRKTLEKVLKLQPERIAYYSYAHVPKLKPAQKSFENHLPNPVEKYGFSHLGKEAFLKAGYHEVGMDHYVLPGDELLIAQKNGELHRNFMGYTPFTSKLLIGLGVSAISDSWSGFAQNEKTIPAYYERLDKNELPILRGHLHTADDLFIRKHILNLMCNFKTTWLPEEFIRFGLNFNYDLLNELQNSGYIQYGKEGLRVDTTGKDVIRIICAALDRDFNKNETKVSFSRSI